jgi:hypothetical protein
MTWLISTCFYVMSHRTRSVIISREGHMEGMWPPRKQILSGQCHEGHFYICYLADVGCHVDPLKMMWIVSLLTCDSFLLMWTLHYLELYVPCLVWQMSCGTWKCHVGHLAQHGHSIPRIFSLMHSQGDHWVKIVEQHAIKNRVQYIHCR